LVCTKLLLGSRRVCIHWLAARGARGRPVFGYTILGTTWGREGVLVFIFLIDRSQDDRHCRVHQYRCLSCTIPVPATSVSGTFANGTVDQVLTMVTSEPNS